MYISIYLWYFKAFRGAAYWCPEALREAKGRKSKRIDTTGRGFRFRIIRIMLLHFIRDISCRESRPDGGLVVKEPWESEFRPVLSRLRRSQRGRILIQFSTRFRVESIILIKLATAKSLERVGQRASACRSSSVASARPILIVLYSRSTPQSSTIMDPSSEIAPLLARISGIRDFVYRR